MIDVDAVVIVMDVCQQSPVSGLMVWCLSLSRLWMRHVTPWQNCSSEWWEMVVVGTVTPVRCLALPCFHFTLVLVACRIRTVDIASTVSNCQFFLSR
jgi:hypothetical protein